MLSCSAHKIYRDPGGSAMSAVASSQLSLTHIIKILGLSIVGAAALLLTSGCGHHKSAASAANTPPQSLSEPVRAVEPAPAQAPSVPSSIDDQYAAQRPGESRALPTFEAPAPPAPPPPANIVCTPPSRVAASAVSSGGDTRDAKGRYHVLQKGETVYAVARMYNVRPQRLMTANQFADANHLSVGTKVYIPD